jgi:hypothetical protein
MPMDSMDHPIIDASGSSTVLRCFIYFYMSNYGFLACFVGKDH